MSYPGSGRADHLELGSYNAVCYQCGRKRKALTLVKNWQGFYVCPEHNEPRQPQDFVRAVPDVQTPPWTQPMPADVFRNYCSPEGVSAIPEFAIPGCAIPGFISPLFDWSQAIPVCYPLLVMIDTTIPASPFTTWCCGELVVGADLTLDGTIGVR